jgi:signal transduction histidine kinase
MSPASTSEGRPIRVYLLDDHEVVRQGLRALLESAGGIEVVGESGSAVEATARIPATKPDVAVLREALSNVARHALADQAEVEIAASPDELTLTVTDNGTGLPAERNESGLRNARRRAEVQGGVLELAAGDPTGTVFRWRVPIG